MSFPRYPKYKASGVEWLGEVPAHWEVAPVASRFRVQLGKMLDSARVVGENLRPYLRVFDVQWGCINTVDLPMMDFDEADRLKFALAKGDLLVNEGGSYPGRSAVWSGDVAECYYQKALHRVRPIDEARASTKFLCSVMEWAVARGVFVAGGNEATIEHLPAEKLRRYRFGFPPLAEQVAIAAFLYRETAKIDALVAEQQRLIELLKEKRQAVISHAVTKGLNPDAKMKPSGVEWLGDVPAHWSVGHSRRLFAPRNERSREGDRQLTASQEYGVIYQDDFVRLEGRRVVEVIKGADILKHVEPGDFVISMRSFQGGIEYCNLRGSISSAYVMLTPRRRLDHHYFSYLFKSLVYIQALQSTTNLVRDGQAMRYGNFVQVDLPTIPDSEAAAIVAFLDREVARSDALVVEAERAIALLQERRTALISAAVTGQIDVRGLATVEVA